MAKLVIEKGEQKGLRIDISQDRPFIVGRDPIADFVTGDQMVSRQHFKIEYVDNKYCIIDLGSLNGTIVDGKRISGPCVISQGSTIRAGQTLFTFLVEDKPDPMIEKILDGYKLLERIGRGGMGTVYKALQIGLGRTVALKVIPTKEAMDKRFIEMLFKEARIAATLNHPNIVQIYDVKWGEDFYFYSMEYMPGGSLRSILETEHIVSFDRALPMMLDMARGLGYAHKKEVIHGDIKPDNMLLSEDMRVKICDLGLARKIHEQELDGLEKSKTIFGTPYYVAPELVRDKKFSYKTDIYSLGATFYETITGVPPFVAESVKELFRKKFSEDPKPITEFVALVPMKLNSIILKMLSRDPAKRYDNMTKVVEELEELRQEFGKKYLPVIPAIKKVSLLIPAAILFVVLAVIGVIFLPQMFKLKKPTHPSVPERPSGPSASDLYFDAKSFQDKNLTPDLKPRQRLKVINECISRFKKVMDLYPDDKAAEMAENALKKLNIQRRLTIGDIFKQEFPRILEIDSKLFGNLVESMNKIDITDYKQGLSNGIRYYKEVKKNYEDLISIDGKIMDDVKRELVGLESWHGLFTKLAQEYEHVLAMVEKDIQKMRYRNAHQKLRKFSVKASKKFKHIRKIETRIRRNRIFWDFFARQMAKRVKIKAVEEWERQEAEIKRYTQDREYQKAIEVVDKVIENFGFIKIVNEAQKTKKKLQKQWEEWKSEIARREQEKILNKDRNLLLSESLRAYTMAKEYRFSEAINTVEKITGELKTQQYKEFAQKRGALIKRSQELFQEFVSMVNNAKTKFRVNVVLERVRKSVELVLIKDNTVVIRYNKTTKEYLLCRLLPPSKLGIYLEGLAKKQKWKFDLCRRLVVFYTEFGFVECAKDFLQYIKDEFKDDNLAQVFVINWQKKLESRMYSGFAEMDAVKIFERIERFLKVKQYKKASEEIDILVEHFKNTKTFVDNRQKVVNWMGQKWYRRNQK